MSVSFFLLNDWNDEMNELTAAHTKLVRLHSVSVEQCNHSSVVSKTEKTSLIIITIISLITFIITAIINISGVLQQIHRRCCCQANRLSGKEHMCLLLLPSLPLFSFLETANKQTLCLLT